MNKSDIPKLLQMLNTFRQFFISCVGLQYYSLN